MFYIYYQNNSGGSFDYNEKSGISHCVIIEADSLTEANNRAESIGLYFDGVSNGSDCDCCGDRWYPASSGTDKPTVYGEPAETCPKDKEDGKWKWMDGYEIFVHYKDGKIKGFWK